MATVGGAQALGLEGQVGALLPGAWADACAYSLVTEDPRESLELLTQAGNDPRVAWIGGRRIRPPEGRSVKEAHSTAE